MADRDPAPFTRTLDPGYRIQRLGDAPELTPDHVLALWARESVVPPQEARRRVHQVLMVATEEATGELVGVSTSMLHRIQHLRLDLWYLRVFVVESARHGNVAAHLLDRCRMHHEAEFVSGQDLRGVGAMVDVQNQGVKRTQNQAIWRHTGLVFVGENARGDHVRVRYFPGALVPGPPAS